MTSNPDIVDKVPSKRLSSSQKKRARKKRAKAAKKIASAALDKADSAAAGKVVEASALSDTDIAALLAKARECATAGGSGEERVSSAMEALKYVLEVQKSVGGDKLVTETLNKVKTGAVKKIGNESLKDESAAEKESRRSELRLRLRATQKKKSDSRRRG